ncbi:MAG: ABC transporter permease [Clostridia bacterium]|nr:ABC transporter permease [Clostridia bacterium]
MNKTGKSFHFGTWLRDNAVMLTFVLLTIAAIPLSAMKLTTIFFELASRISRNAFLILALILPIVAGMGINFAITIGAMGAQIALLLTLNWQIPGFSGIATAAAMTVPLAGFFGYLVGKLLNRMKGQEMIGSMILGYFANGLYQVLFLFVFGQLIPIANRDLTILGGKTGISNTLDLNKGVYAVKGGLDNLWKLPFGDALYIASGVVLFFMLITMIDMSRIPFLKKSKLAQPDDNAILVEDKSIAYKLKRRLPIAIIFIAACAVYQIPVVAQQFMMVRVPMVTAICIALLGLFNVVIMRTRLGQRFRAVGQSQTVANAAGINVNRTRLIAIILSTIFAGWGQLIYLQSLGIMQTYAAHESIGLYAGAAILVGGATIVRATNGQAILGCVLFHVLFVVAPKVGVNVFGDAAIGEFFRVFVSFGVIALALVLHGLRNRPYKPRDLRNEAGIPAAPKPAK